MKKILLGLTLLASLPSFAIDCSCYAELEVFEGKHHGKSQFSKRHIYLGTYTDLSFLEIPLAKVSCSNEVAEWQGDSSDASSNLECDA